MRGGCATLLAFHCHLKFAIGAQRHAAGRKSARSIVPHLPRCKEPVGGTADVACAFRALEDGFGV